MGSGDSKTKGIGNFGVSGLGLRDFAFRISWVSGFGFTWPLSQVA